jgi:uncharacterized membrane protein YfcA
MDFFLITFQTAGIQVYAFLPPVVAFTISFFTSMAGISGAFLLLPFQVSILGFVTPSVSATNFLYNAIGTPGGIVSYIKNKRMVWPLMVCILLGSVPGVLIGYYLRVTLMPDPKTFKLFVGIVLLYVGWRLFLELRHHHNKQSKEKILGFQVKHLSFSPNAVHFNFNGQNIIFRVSTVMLLCLIVGIISGIYGIGVVSPPDFLLGLLFGVGGLIGMYFGAKFQHRVPEVTIKIVLLVIIITVSGKYIYQFL